MEEIQELKRQGMTIQGISNVTGYDRKSIRKYLKEPARAPVYGPREPRASKLDRFKHFIGERCKAGVWNAVVLLRELRERGYDGGYTILKDYLQPRRREARVVAVRRFETPPGQQAQVDWGHLGSIETSEGECKLWVFVLTLGHSRAIAAEAAVDQKLGTLLRLHEEAFRQLGGVPKEILYDRMKTVWLGTDERGEIEWNPVFHDFADYWGFTPRLCRPYRAQTKGKVESGIRYVRRNFLCGLAGQEPGDLTDFNNRLRAWVWEVANLRIHGTTHQQVKTSWESERLCLLAIDGRMPYPFGDEQPRRVSRDAYVAWQGNRYSVPWQYAGREVWARQRNGRLEVVAGGDSVAIHALATGRHGTIRRPEHHAGIPLGNTRQPLKATIRIRKLGPEVEVRPLEAYESVAIGGVR